ncbi:MAG: hypothetical protein JW910_00605 [Anaerolineae bacterium]|nr:hypothetical protein [Anaerolineae bacterium]
MPYALQFNTQAVAAIVHDATRSYEEVFDVLYNPASTSGWRGSVLEAARKHNVTQRDLGAQTRRLDVIAPMQH